LTSLFNRYTDGEHALSYITDSIEEVLGQDISKHLMDIHGDSYDMSLEISFEPQLDHNWKPTEEQVEQILIKTGAGRLFFNFADCTEVFAEYVFKKLNPDGMPLDAARKIYVGKRMIKASVVSRNPYQRLWQDTAPTTEGMWFWTAWQAKRAILLEVFKSKDVLHASCSSTRIDGAWTKKLSEIKGGWWQQCMFRPTPAELDEHFGPAQPEV